MTIYYLQYQSIEGRWNTKDKTGAGKEGSTEAYNPGKFPAWLKNPELIRKSGQKRQLYRKQKAFEQYALDENTVKTACIWY